MFDWSYLSSIPQTAEPMLEFLQSPHNASDIFLKCMPPSQNANCIWCWGVKNEWVLDEQAVKNEQNMFTERGHVMDTRKATHSDV